MKCERMIASQNYSHFTERRLLLLVASVGLLGIDLFPPMNGEISLAQQSQLGFGEDLGSRYIHMCVSGMSSAFVSTIFVCITG